MLRIISSSIRGSIFGVLVLYCISDIGFGSMPFPDLWFQGSYDQALSMAKKENKPIFVYWGAEWCPPCNELKSQVFSKTRFKELMGMAIPIYIDGDQKDAQILSDRLGVVGYPTILVVSSEGKELLKISEAVNIEEFDEVFRSSVEGLMDFSEIVRMARDESTVTQSMVWKSLVFARDDQFRQESDRLNEDNFDLLNTLYLNAPAGEIKTRFAAKVLTEVASSSKEGVKAFGVLSEKKVREIFEDFFGNSNKSLIAVNRSVIIGETSNIFLWLASRVKKESREKERILAKKTYEEVRGQWLQRANVFRSGLESVDLRLWAVYPELELFRIEHPKKFFPANLVKKVETAVSKANLESKNEFDRKSVISGAAYLLKLVGSYGSAKNLLIAERNKSTTPWYYESSLASLAEKQQDFKGALNWSKEASDSALGSATELQWKVSQWLINFRLIEHTSVKILKKLTVEVFELAFKKDDGFSGRNLSRLNRVYDKLKNEKHPDIYSLLGGFRSGCKKRKAKVFRDSCQNYFSQLDLKHTPKNN